MRIMTMGTTRIHMRLVDRFVNYSIEKEKEDPHFIYSREQIALVENYNKLIDVSKLTDAGRQIVRSEMGQLKHTYPDFMCFKNNPVIMNNNQTLYAGIPDLIIEVWSKANTTCEKEQKRKLYRTSKSEFWELDQDSPKIICWNKDGKQYEQLIDSPIKTPWGDEIDLTDLAYAVTDKFPNDRFSGGPDIGRNIDLPMIED